MKLNESGKQKLGMAEVLLASAASVHANLYPETNSRLRKKREPFDSPGAPTRRGRRGWGWGWEGEVGGGGGGAGLFSASGWRLK